MELSNIEKRVACGAAMYLLGIEIEAGREEMEHMVQQGFSFSSEAVLNKNHSFNQLTMQFTEIEERYLQLYDELLQEMP